MKLIKPIKMYLRFVVTLFLSGIITLAFETGCSSNPYRKAEILLNQKHDKEALKIYLGLANANRQDMRALIGAAIAYRNLGKPQACMKLCRTVLKIKPNHAAALYYLGCCLEELGQTKMAMKYYGQYNFVSRDDPYYSFLKARMNIMKFKGHQ